MLGLAKHLKACIFRSSM